MGTRPSRLCSWSRPARRELGASGTVGRSFRSWSPSVSSRPTPPSLPSSSPRSSGLPGAAPAELSTDRSEATSNRPSQRRHRASIPNRRSRASSTAARRGAPQWGHGRIRARRTTDAIAMVWPTFRYVISITWRANVVADCLGWSILPRGVSNRWSGSKAVGRSQRRALLGSQFVSAAPPLGHLAAT